MMRTPEQLSTFAIEKRMTADEGTSDIQRITNDAPHRPAAIS